MRWPLASLASLLLACSSSSGTPDGGDGATGDAAPGKGGTLDPSFGDKGVAQIDGTTDLFRRIGVASDGAIVIGGNGTPTATKVFARFDATGKPVATFGTGGVSSIQPSTMGTASDFALDASGRIVVVGEHVPTSSTQQNGFELARVGLDGNLDTTFGTGGEAIVQMTMASVNSVFVRPDATIEVVGTLSSPSIFVARLTAAGGLDTSFGTNGVRVTPNLYVDLAQFAPDGSFYALTSTSTVPGLLLHFDADGNLDTAFGADGGLVIPFDAPDASGGLTSQFAAGPVFHDALGDSLAVGWNAYNQTDCILGAHRITPAGDTSISADGGHSATNVSAPLLHTSLLLHDGRVLLGGQSTAIGAFAGELADDAGLTVFDALPDGGTALTAKGFYDVRVFAFDAQGAVLVAGSTTGTVFRLARLVL